MIARVGFYATHSDGTHTANCARPDMTHDANDEKGDAMNCNSTLTHGNRHRLGPGLGLAEARR